MRRSVSVRERVGDHMLRRESASKPEGRSTASLNALPESSPLLLRFPVETSSILSQATA